MESDKDYFDIIILGGGAGGLFLGCHLAENLKVLIIDKGQIGTSKHAWTYWSDQVEKYGLEKYISYKLDNAKARSVLGKEVKIKLGECIKFCPVIDEDNLLSDKADQLNKLGATLISDCSFISEEKVGDLMCVNTSRGTFRAKLVIDAMGQTSPLIERYNLFKRVYYYTVYGWSIDQIGLPEGEYDFLETVLDKRPIPFWWSIPMGRGKDFIGSFYLSKKPEAISLARQDFDELIAVHPYTQNKTLNKQKEYFGSIPCAVKFNKEGVDNIAFIGDSRGWGFGFGWGFSPIVDNAQEISERLYRCVKENRLKGSDLVDATDIKFSDPTKDLNAKLEELVVVFLIDATIPQIDRMVEIFSNYPKILEKLCLFRLEKDEVISLVKAIFKEFSIIEIVKIFSRGDLIFLIEEFLDILQDAHLIDQYKINKNTEV